MKLPLALALLLAAMPHATHARIGESEAEIAVRYGKPSGEPSAADKTHYSTADTVKRYIKSGLVVIVATKGGKSVAELYRTEKGGELPTEAVLALIDANKDGEGNSWRTADIGDGKGYWFRSDVGAVSIEDTNGLWLEIITMAYHDEAYPTLPKHTAAPPPAGF